LVDEGRAIVSEPSNPIGTTVREGAARRRARSDTYRETEQRLEPFEQLARIVIMHRARLGLSQQELAERMGTTASVISRIESGHHRVSIETVRKLAAAFQIRAVVGFEYEADDIQQHELIAL
jgi:ribosome-binding protein aMBF1 (putative translation factor)